MSHALFAASNPLGFLTQFGVEWRLLVSQGVSFGIVAVALYFLVFRPVIRASTKRQEEIEKGLKDAELARQKLAASQDEADARVRKAAQEATAILDQARENAKKTKEIYIEKNRKIQALKTQVDAAKQAIENIKNDKDERIGELYPVYKATVAAYSDMIDESDWKYSDLLIYYFETKRADDMKEALQLLRAFGDRSRFSYYGSQRMHLRQLCRTGTRNRAGSYTPEKERHEPELGRPAQAERHQRVSRPIRYRSG